MRRFKVLLSVLLTVLVLTTGLFATKAGIQCVADPSNQEKIRDAQFQKNMSAFLTAEIQKGHFLLKKTQTDSLNNIEHKRYQQVYEGLSVWTGEIIQHVKDGKIQYYDGEFFEVGQVNTLPKLTPSQAKEALEAYYKTNNLRENDKKRQLVIFPLSDKEFRLAYKMIVSGTDGKFFSETALVDAENGQVLQHFSNIKIEDLTIGMGVGQRGDTLKFPTYSYNSTYYLWDPSAVRPFTQRTFNANHGLPYSINVSSSSSNSWSQDDIVNIHTYIGYAYDFYYKKFGLQGVDGVNLPLDAFAHVFSTYYGYYDNAFWNPEEDLYGQGFYFLDPYHSGQDMGAAIDIVCHEYGHAVTTFHSDLIYYGESGALNESFSDISGSMVEWMVQPEGEGYNKADWINGEDANSPFTYSKCRSQSDPNSNSQLKNAGFPSSYWYNDPCHIAEKVPTLYYYGQIVDNNNVHINGTIFPHAFYLLAHGGTNRKSQLSVTGIGIEKASKIFYNAWVNHMGAGSNFLAAANALYTSAQELYGSSSAEMTQTKNMLRAIGYIVS